MPICDGCGAQVDAEHIRQRIERLELATRFRPIHIQVLLVDTAPPLRPEDFFYRAPEDPSTRSASSRTDFDDLVHSVGIAVTPDLDEKVTLADFQRRGFFLVSVLECPIEPIEEVLPAEKKGARFGARIEKASPTFVTRLKGSYKPRNIALLSTPTRELLPTLQAAGWSDRLILDKGSPFLPPFSGKLFEALLHLK